jgi:hypothetical protein
MRACCSQGSLRPVFLRLCNLALEPIFGCVDIAKAGVCDPKRQFETPSQCTRDVRLHGDLQGPLSGLLCLGVPSSTDEHLGPVLEGGYQALNIAIFGSEVDRPVNMLERIFPTPPMEVAGGEIVMCQSQDSPVACSFGCGEDKGHRRSTVVVVAVRVQVPPGRPGDTPCVAMPSPRHGALDRRREGGPLHGEPRVGGISGVLKPSQLAGCPIGS